MNERYKTFEKLYKESIIVHEYDLVESEKKKTEKAVRKSSVTNTKKKKLKSCTKHQQINRKS